MLSRDPFAACTVGERYEAELPDTLDLAERMELAINALTNVWVPDEKWAMLVHVDFARRPNPVLWNGDVMAGHIGIPPKFLEALLLCRLGSGSTNNLEVDANVMRAQLGFVGEDGLSYAPTDTLKQLNQLPGQVGPRPYLADQPIHADGYSYSERPSEFAEVWCEGRMLLVLAMLAQIDDDSLWIELGKRKVDRMLALTREKEGFRFLWEGRFSPGETVPADADEPAAFPKLPFVDGVEPPTAVRSLGALGHAAGLFYRVTGYEPALALAGGLARWAMARIFKNPDGRWGFDHWEPGFGHIFHHFHHSLYALMAVCEYASITDDRAMLERVDACYRWAREMGDPLIGFYPELLPGCERYLRRQGNSVEICEIADIIWLALHLTKAGVADYWDDVDRWVRNVFTEGQMLDASFLERIPESYFGGLEPRVHPIEDTRDVLERSVGSFFGWMRANDGLTVHFSEREGETLHSTFHAEIGPKLPDRSIMHCCTGNGSRTLYYVWDVIVTRDGDDVRVNLLLNRGSPWLDVDSYIPAEGKVVLHIKDARNVAVRLPEWCEPATVGVRVGEESRNGQVHDRYLRLRGLRAGEQVTLRFPLPELTLHRVIGEFAYKLELRGSNVVSIDPKGIGYPLYARQPSGELLRRTRFIPRAGQLIW